MTYPSRALLHDSLIFKRSKQQSLPPQALLIGVSDGITQHISSWDTWHGLNHSSRPRVTPYLAHQPHPHPHTQTHKPNVNTCICMRVCMYAHIYICIPTLIHPYLICCSVLVTHAPNMNVASSAIYAQNKRQHRHPQVRQTPWRLPYLPHYKQGLSPYQADHRNMQYLKLAKPFR